MAQTHHTKLLIIGAGPAGYTAAVYAARANLKPILVQGMQPGGQLTITTDVENYPGFADTIQGPWLMEQMQAQATKVGTQVIFDVINEVDFSKRHSNAPRTPAISLWPRLLSSPPARRRVGSASIAKRSFQGYGVSGCATCDGFSSAARKSL